MSSASGHQSRFFCPRALVNGHLPAFLSSVFASMCLSDRILAFLLFRSETAAPVLRGPALPPFRTKGMMGLLVIPDRRNEMRVLPLAAALLLRPYPLDPDSRNSLARVRGAPFGEVISGEGVLQAWEMAALREIEPVARMSEAKSGCERTGRSRMSLRSSGLLRLPEPPVTISERRFLTFVTISVTLAANLAHEGLRPVMPAEGASAVPARRQASRQETAWARRSAAFAHPTRCVGRDLGANSPRGRRSISLLPGFSRVRMKRYSAAALARCGARSRKCGKDFLGDRRHVRARHLVRHACRTGSWSARC